MIDTEISQLCWGYRKGGQPVPLLDRLDLSIGAGEIVAILGQSGSGKSSLLNLISGIEAAHSGHIRVGASQLSDLSEPARTEFRRQHIGFIYQFFNLIPTLTVAENIGLVLELNKRPPAEAQQAVAKLLAELGLAQKADDYPDRLSGGEQQRVAIARALIHQPALILADEPTGNLDTHTGQKVLQLLVQQTRTHNSSLVLVTHSQRVAEQADRVFSLVDGRLVAGAGELAW